MGLGFPHYLALLAGIIPLILLLHSLRPKGVRLRTTALFLLERVLKERPLGSRFGWLFRKNILLLLQLLIACLLVGALADPFLVAWGPAGGEKIVVFDLSASMKAGDREGSRFEKGRRELIGLIEKLASGQRMMIIGAGPAPRIVTALTDDTRRLREAARGLAPTDAPGAVKDAILLAHSFVRAGSDDEVVVVSDGAFAGAEDLPWGSPQLRWIPVNGGKNNAGIVAFEVRRAPPAAHRYEVFLRVRNFMDREIKTNLSVSLGEKTWRREELAIAAGASATVVYPHEGPLPRRAEAALDLADDLPVDNRAYLALAEFAGAKILYVGKGNPFLAHLFNALPELEVTSVERLPAGFSAAGARAYDVVIFDGVGAPPLAEGNFILINAGAENSSFRPKGKVARPRPLPALPPHPLAAGARLDELYVGRALAFSPPQGAAVLLAARETPLIWALEESKLKALVIGFDLMESDLPYKVAFPVLFSNALQWFQPRRPAFPAIYVRAGTPYALALRGGEKQVEFTAPDGSRTVVRADANPLLFTETQQAGFFTYGTGEREGEFAVNLFDEEESDIRPRIGGAAAGAKRAAQALAERTRQLWPYLLAIAALALAIEAFLAARAPLSKYALAGRALALGGAMIALANPRFVKPATALDVVVAVDQSLSVGQGARQAAAEVLQQAGRARADDTRVGLLSFARQPLWEFPPGRDFPAAEPALLEKRDATNIQAALEAALGQIGAGRQGRVLIVSDGNENRGAVSRVIPLLGSSGVQVWTLPVNLAPGKNEILLADFQVPPEVDSAETFPLKAAVETLRPARARLTVLRDGRLLSRKEVALEAGKNWFRLEQALGQPGVYTFELAVHSAEDVFAENNVAQGIVKVKGPPRVLYLHGRDERQQVLARALASQGYAVAQARAGQRGLALAELSAYDLVVLDNVAAYELATPEMEELEKYVRDLGGGLIVSGGPQSYGAGGYLKTPLERVLPLDLRPPSQIDLPQVALVFVLDKSGSMGGSEQGVTKLELAKAAALAAADLLNPHDQVGILAFDAGFEWLLPFRPVGKGEWITESLASVQSDGGTDLYQALVEAYRGLAGKNAPVKHVLVLSDGLTDKMDFATLARRMAADGITISTVALGKDADTALMALIAQLGKGRAYVTIDHASVPHIFTTETLLAARDLIVERAVKPQAVQSGGPLEGIAPADLPPVRGYVLTYPRAHADLLLKAGDDPLLATWRYGLGRVAAFTSDLTGRWGREWVQWGEFPRFAAQLARSVRRATTDALVRAEIQQEEDELKVVLDVFSPDGAFANHLKLEGAVSGGEQPARANELRQIAPGRYEGRFSEVGRGVHVLTVYDARAGHDRALVASLPFVSSYSREYRALRPDLSLLSRLAERTGGQMLDPENLDEGVKRLLTPSPEKARSSQETWWAFSALSLALFLADLALRRWPAA
ncbi:MAG TPA: VWA domain-containing protein [Candidatus Acidoferrales bacterium]|nr:VWA domain-containing protein [Candidatus Acidoferrales bacterium]